MHVVPEVASQPATLARYRIVFSSTDPIVEHKRGAVSKYAGQLGNPLRRREADIGRVVVRQALTEIVLDGGDGIYKHLRRVSLSQYETLALAGNADLRHSATPSHDCAEPPTPESL